MKRRHAAACAHCGNVGKPRQLNELLERDRNEPAIALCDQCVRLLKYADARTWEWFREYRDRLISSPTQMKPRHAVIPRRIMTAVEVAQHLKTHPRRVYNLARNGQIPAFKIGADYRFYRDAIEKLSPIDSKRK
jgi:excisionase family DNA binding protein